MATAKHRAIDQLRRGKMLGRKHEELGRELELQARLAEPDLAAAADDDIGDDLLRLIFTACHPVLSTEARVALTLRLLGGLTTDEIARAFLVPEPTIAQRIVRAKRTLAEARVPFEVPRGDELAARLRLGARGDLPRSSTRATRRRAGDDWMRPALCEEALRLGRILAGLAPHGAGGARPGGADGDPGVALARAESAPTGEPILLLDQNRARWDQLLIGRGLAALERAEALGGAARPLRAAGGDRGLPRAGADAGADRLAADRRALRRRSPRSPLAGRASSTAPSRWRMAFGPAAGLELVDGLRREPRCAATTCCRASRGDLLARLGREEEAAAEFARAAALSGNARERELLLARAEGRR